MTPDEMTVEALAQHLTHPVRLVLESDPSFPLLIESSEPQSESSIVSVDDQVARVAIRLASGAWACWKTDGARAQATLNHAKTILLLQATNSERNHLLAEADALATQVVNDFEELSLLRKFASMMELPHAGVGVSEMASKCLRPLARGIGAVSIAAQFIGEDDKTFLQPRWSGETLAPAEVLRQLIERHREEAEEHPVVRNGINEFGEEDHWESIEEFILLECRSEGRLHGWLIACNRTPSACDRLPWAQRGFTTVQATLLETATHQLAAQVHNLRLLRQKEALYTDVVRALVNAVDARDPYTSGHSERVARFAKFLGKAIGESEAACDRIYLTGLLHDVGKIAVPDGVLRKPGHLDERERAIIESHTEAGWRILHELEALREVLPGVLYHHEHYDGNGYPDGLVGDSIPLDGRILAVCDAFDAMTSDRPYRDGMPTEKAADILRGGAGRFWDPKLVDTFIANLAAIDQIRVDHRPRQHAVRPVPQNGQPVT